MRNIDKYLTEILSEKEPACAVHMLRTGSGCQVEERCEGCIIANKEWLEAEYVEPEVDWSKVKQGTRVYCKGDGLHDDRRFVSTYWQDGHLFVVTINENSLYDMTRATVHLAKDCRLEM